MSIELPPLPPLPNADSTPEQWAHYRWTVSLHVTAEQTAAINRQAIATEDTASIAQQMLDQPQPSTSGFSESFVISLLRLVLEKPEAPVP